MVELLELESEELLVLTAPGYLFLHLGESLLCLAILIVCGPVVAQQLAVLSDDVNHVELEILFLQQQVLML